VLVITSEWPSAGRPVSGIFVRRQVEYLENSGIKVTVFAFRGRANPFRYVKAWLSVRGLLRRSDFDIVHAQFGQSALVALPAGRPFVITFRGSDLAGYVGRNGRLSVSGRLLRSLSRRAAEFADAVVLVSTSLRSHLDPRIDPFIIPSGVDTSLFKPLDRSLCRKELGWSEEAFILLFLSSKDDPIKRFELARRAAEIAGKSAPVTLETAWGIPQDRVPLYMNAADALVLTSVSEGSPNVVKEAVACGLPVIAVPVGDVVERLAEVPGSIVCENDSPDSIAASIIQLYDNTRMNGRPAFVPQAVVSEETSTRRLIELYRQILNKNMGAAPGFTGDKKDGQ